MQLSVNNITGFKCASPIIEILDNTGKRFYYFENPNEDVISFNLPTGDYETENEVFEMEKPVVYICPDLPRPEKNIVPKTINFEVGSNPHKASVDVNTGEVLIDEEKIWSKEIPFKVFVCFHEMGHCLYYTEWKCDVFSAFEMIKRGFNPSQCLYSSEFCLSDASKDRKDILFKWLKKITVK